jgi:hypothetical protein
VSTVNYVAALWQGERFMKHGPNEPIEYLRVLLNQLKKIEHNLAQVTLVHPEIHPGHGHDGMNPQYKDLLYGDHSTETTKVEVMIRPNGRLAFGSYSDAYAKYRDTQPPFTHYIFAEDDYAPVMDGFDQVLINLLEEKKVGVLCAHISPTQSETYKMPHIGVPLGIAKSEAFEAVYQMFGSLFFDKSALSWYWENQLAFSYALIKAGVIIGEFGDIYSVPCWYSNDRRVIEYGKTNVPAIFWPYQKLS